MENEHVANRSDLGSAGLDEYRVQLLDLSPVLATSSFPEKNPGGGFDRHATMLSPESRLLPGFSRSATRSYMNKYTLKAIMVDFLLRDQVPSCATLGLENRSASRPLTGTHFKMHRNNSLMSLLSSSCLPRLTNQ